MPAKARIKPSAELRGLRKRCGVFNPMFATMDAGRESPGIEITQEQAAALCKALESRFASWWDSWVEPELKYLEKRGF